MKTKHIAEALDENLKTIGVVFDSEANTSSLAQITGKIYTYKTYSDCLAGEYVVVQVRNELRIARIVEVHDTPAIDYDSEIDYHWIVIHFDLSDFKEFLKERAIFNEKLKQLYVNRTRRSFKEQVMLELGMTEEDRKALGLSFTEGAK